MQHNPKYQNTEAIFFPKPQLLFEYFKKKVTKKLCWCSPSALQKNYHQSCLWLVSLPLTQMSLAGDCASSRVLPSYTFASGLSPSSWPLCLLPLGVSAPWTCATLIPFTWPEQGDSPNVCVLWNTYFWRLQTLLNLWSDIAKHWIVTLRYPPLRWYGTNDCHRDPMVNTEVI